MENLGCSHYQRKCKILAPCCGVWYPCRLCHNENYAGPKKGGCQVETMDRRAVSTIQCLSCHEEQAASNTCQKCLIEFARYYCPICKFWDDHPTKNLYHCEKCGICRVGIQDQNFHCDSCKGDFSLQSKNTHKCTNDGMVNNCPVCFEDLFSSRKSVQRLDRCGHFIHSECLRSCLTKGHSNRCPICSKSIFEEDEGAVEELDQLIESTRENMPPELKDKRVNILCNDCLEKSTNVLFHFLGIKCQNCGSYNTRETH